MRFQTSSSECDVWRAFSGRPLSTERHLTPTPVPSSRENSGGDGSLNAWVSQRRCPNTNRMVLLREMARPNPAARDAVVEATQRLMVAKGYAATTVEQICHEAETTKGTFFHYFSSKEAIAKAALERFTDTQRAALDSGPHARDLDPLKRFDGFIEFVAQSLKDPIRDSCLVGILAHEMSDTHPEFRAMCRAALGRSAHDLKQLLDEIRARYAPTKLVDTQSLADLFVIMSQGAYLVSKAKGSPGPMRSALRHYQAYVHSVLGVRPSRTSRSPSGARTAK